jgi:tol-pal system protein YbgF
MWQPISTSGILEKMSLKRNGLLVGAVLSTVLGAATLSAPRSALAQMSDVDPAIRVEQLESQLRQLTGQNEELQYRNRRLEEQLRQLQQGQSPVQGAGAPDRGNVAAMPPQQQPAPYEQQQQPPMQQVAAPPASPGRGRRGDAFDPNANPGAPGAPRALGGGPGPVMAPSADVDAPGGRNAGEPLDLSRPNAAREASVGQYPQDGMAPAGPRDAGAPMTAPPTSSPRDEYDLGYGYMLRKDYALAEQTLRYFLQKYPTDRQVPEAQYWLGEALFQQQHYRDAAEAFLHVTTKFDTSSKAPDALLRLGQSLAALKEKEAACAAFGEVTRKYPKAAAGIKSGVTREQKRVGC